MIAHYETQPSNPPSAVILKLARAVSTFTDELLGLQRPAMLPPLADAPRSTLDGRLWRKLQKIGELPEDKRRALLTRSSTGLSRVSPTAVQIIRSGTTAGTAGARPTIGRPK